MDRTGLAAALKAARARLAPPDVGLPAGLRRRVSGLTARTNSGVASMTGSAQPPAVKLRPAVSDDWPAIWPIWHSIVSAGDTYVWDPGTTKDVARALWMLPAPAEVWVLEDDRGTIVATAELKPNQAGLGDHIANASFMVDPTHSGHGLGRILGQAIVERARQAGYHGMQFNAVVATNQPAIRLWRSLGFAVVGTIPEGFRHSQRGLVDLLVMYQRLDPPDR